jgi:hypothetical protein
MRGITRRKTNCWPALLEAVQKQAVPPWFTPIGISFRFDLLRVRLFSNVDRLVLTIHIPAQRVEFPFQNFR